MIANGDFPLREGDDVDYKDVPHASLCPMGLPNRSENDDSLICMLLTPKSAQQIPNWISTVSFNSIVANQSNNAHGTYCMCGPNAALSLSRSPRVLVSLLICVCFVFIVVKGDPSESTGTGTSIHTYLRTCKNVYKLVLMAVYN